MGAKLPDVTDRPITQRQLAASLLAATHIA